MYLDLTGDSGSANLTGPLVERSLAWLVADQLIDPGGDRTQVRPCPGRWRAGLSRALARWSVLGRWRDRVRI